MGKIFFREGEGGGGGGGGGYFNTPTPFGA